jgi:hypothetical protein
MTEVYYVWLNERLARQEDFIGIENSPHFDSSSYEEKMSTTHQTVKLIFGPEMLGWPVARDRLTLFSWRHSEWVWVGPDLATVATDFRTLFQRKAAGRAAALSTAPVAVDGWWQLPLFSFCRAPDMVIPEVPEVPKSRMEGCSSGCS